MKRYFIEDAKHGCYSAGPSGTVVAQIKFNDGEKTQWISLSDVDGIANVCLTDRDIFNDLINETEDKSFWDYVNEKTIFDFDGIGFDETNEDIIWSYLEDRDNPATPLIRYLVSLINCDFKDVDNLINLAKGKYADELEYPACELEKEVLEEMAEEDEE